MADFTKSFARTSLAEGGYQAKTSDKGNFYKGVLIGTNRGISAPVLAAYLGRMPTVAEMKALSAELAKQLYHDNYWVPIQGDRISNQSIAELIMDFAINSGPFTAVHHTQEALRALGLAITADGVLGPKTLAAINSAPQEGLFNRIKAEREDLYRALASGSTDYREWLAGWLTRLDKFLFLRPAPVPPVPAAGGPCS